MWQVCFDLRVFDLIFQFCIFVSSLKTTGASLCTLGVIKNIYYDDSNPKSKLFHEYHYQDDKSR